MTLKWTRDDVRNTAVTLLKIKILGGVLSYLLLLLLIPNLFANAPILHLAGFFYFVLWININMLFVALPGYTLATIFVFRHRLIGFLRERRERQIQRRLSP